MRIVSLLPAATDIVASLGALDQLVGRTHECDWPVGRLDHIPIVTTTSLPHDLSSREISAAVSSGSHRGSSIYQLAEAALAALRPDLILTQDLCRQCAVSYRTVNEAVRVIELDTMVMSLQPSTIDGVLQAITTVAEVIGAQPQASAIAEEAAQRLGALPGPQPDGPKVLFVEWLDPLMPGGHWVPEQIAYAGGVSLLTGPGEHSTPHRWEVVSELAPDVIVFGPCGFTPAQTLRELAGFAELPGQQWVVDGPAYFNRPGPRVIDGAEILAGVLKGRPQPGAAWPVSLGGS